MTAKSAERAAQDGAAIVRTGKKREKVVRMITNTGLHPLFSDRHPPLLFLPSPHPVPPSSPMFEGDESGSSRGSNVFALAHFLS